MTTHARGAAVAALSTLVALFACDPADRSDGDREANLEEADDEEESDAPASAAAERVAAEEQPMPPVPPDIMPGAMDLAAKPDAQPYITKGWVSEEGPALTCGTGQLASGFGCSGGYCDNVGLECQNYGGVIGESSWSVWFSEEAPSNFFQCPGAGYISGVTCSGSSCDNLSVECSETNLAKYNCTWTPTWYSEEQGWYLTYGAQAIAGMWCSGSNCDSKRYLVCNTV